MKIYPPARRKIAATMIKPIQKPFFIILESPYTVLKSKSHAKQYRINEKMATA